MSQGWTRREILIAAAVVTPAILSAGCWRDSDDPLRFRHWLTASDSEAAALDVASPEGLSILRSASTTSVIDKDRQALDQMRLQSRVLTEVEGVELSVRLFGVSCSALWVAPHPSRSQLAPDGEVRTLRSAGRTGTTMFIDGASGASLDDLASERAAPIAWQLRGDSLEERLDELELAAKLGSAAVAVASRGGLPERSESKSFEALVAKATVPVLARGDIDAGTARRWLDAGAGGLVLSNAESPWARPSSPAAAEALPEVVDAIDARVPVLFEGNVRSGIDALKALALGASAVVVGLPVLWGLAAASTAGVQQVLTLLHQELGTAMGLCGSRAPAQLQRSLVRTAPWA